MADEEIRVEPGAQHSRFAFMGKFQVQFQLSASPGWDWIFHFHAAQGKRNRSSPALVSGKTITVMCTAADLQTRLDQIKEDVCTANNDMAETKKARDEMRAQLGAAGDIEEAINGLKF